MSKLIDMTGKKINRLTVLERAANNSQGKAQWKCKCECGNIIIIEGSSLRNGHTKSCGCYQRDRTSESCKINLVGQTIGNFTVLDYCQKEYEDKGRSKWKCRCNLCNNEEVYLTTDNMKNQFSCGCTIKSKGEIKIKNILKENNIQYVQEKRFSDCVFKDTNAVARFDFYLPEYNCIVEYDGIQHFKQGNGIFDNKNKFELTQQHDMIKNIYCKEHNITLIRIPYTHYNSISIEDLLPNKSKYIID